MQEVGDGINAFRMRQVPCPLGQGLDGLQRVGPKYSSLPAVDNEQYVVFSAVGCLQLLFGKQIGVVIGKKDVDAGVDLQTGSARGDQHHAKQIRQQ